MSLSRTFSPVLHFEDSDGPLAGGWLCTYLAGTNTPVATFRNGSGALNPTKIQLDSRGECEVWLDAAIRYKFALYDCAWTPVWVKDDITAPGVVVMPDTKEVYVVGTSPVLVTAVTLNGITTYTVALDSTFTQAVSDNTTNIANEITRAQNAEGLLNTAIGNEVTRATNKENELGTAIANEVTRATAAEKAAKTEVKAGDNIEVTKTTGADGHDIYTVNGVESVPNVEITSPNNTISVSSSEDQQTNTKTFSIDVHEKPLSVAWVESDNMTYIPSTNQLSASSYNLLDRNGLQNPQGDKIVYDPVTKKLSLDAGHYTMLIKFLVTWTGTPQNKTIFVNDEPFDLSYQHTQTVTLSALHQLLHTVSGIGIAVTLSEAPPQGFTCKISRASIYSVQQVLENVVQGLTEVHHDETLSGTGTEDDPLSVEGGGGGLQEVVHDATMTGDGTSENPLSVNGVVPKESILNYVEDWIDISNEFSLNSNCTVYKSNGVAGSISDLHILFSPSKGWLYFNCAGTTRVLRSISISNNNSWYSFLRYNGNRFKTPLNGGFFRQNTFVNPIDINRGILLVQMCSSSVGTLDVCITGYTTESADPSKFGISCKKMFGNDTSYGFLIGQTFWLVDIS